MKVPLPSFIRKIFGVKNDANSSKNAQNIKRVEHDYHKLTLEELAREFQTSITNGLDTSQASKVLARDGKNVIVQYKQNAVLKLISFLFTGFCGLLWIAGIICIIAYKPIGNPPDPVNLGLGILLICVILLQAAFSAFQDWSSGKVMNSIKNMIPSAASVIRNGKEEKIPAENLVIGDLVLLTYGSKVPADVRIIESHDLKFDKSMLTGESEAVEGTIDCTDESYVESKNIGFMTTLITNGQGKGVVVCTGAKTVMGTIASLTTETGDRPTTLQLELRRFVMIIASVAVTTALIVIILWVAWLRVKYPGYIDVPSLMVNTISVLVAFIPESLPVCVTLSLLIIAKRMAKSRVLVKNLSTVETLSCVNVIASDKTGTLTQNKMFVASASIGLDRVDVKNLETNKHNVKQLNQLLALCSICNNAKFDESDMQTPIRQRKTNGDATDTALLKFSHEYLDNKDLPKMYANIVEIPFNSKNKWMMKLIKPNDKDLHESIFGKQKTKVRGSTSSVESMDSNLMLLKGAPDILLKKCRYVLDSDGNERPLTSSLTNDIVKIQNDWCILGQRVLILCKKSNVNLVLSQAEAEETVINSNDFCMVGMVGIIDPPREGIEDVISQCRGAGVRVFMVTGDYALTAAAIATQIGIFTAPQYDTVEVMHLKTKESAFQSIDDDGKSSKKSSQIRKGEALLLTGNDLESLTKEDWRTITQYEEIVFARTTPEQKLRTVKEFQQDGYVVGVTGDGVNDAPALKSADIGIAMGGGSEVAMEAAQLILLDNNFSSILIAIKNGRLVFANLRKVILYLLPGGCMAELTPVLLSILLGVPQDLSSFQMIIISLFTDVGPCLSLMMEKPEVDLLKQPPRSKSDHLVDWKFIIQAYLFLGVIISFFSQCMFFIYMQWYANFKVSEILFSFGSWQEGFKNLTQVEINEFYYTGQTVTFVCLVLLQIIGNLWSTRTHIKSFFQQALWRKLTRNVWILIADTVSICIMVIIVFVPIFNSFFNTRPIPAQFFFLPLVFCLIIFILDETRKLFVRKKLFKFHKFGW